MQRTYQEDRRNHTSPRPMGNDCVQATSCHDGSSIELTKLQLPQHINIPKISPLLNSHTTSSNQDSVPSEEVTHEQRFCTERFCICEDSKTGHQRFYILLSQMLLNISVTNTLNEEIHCRKPYSSLHDHCSSLLLTMLMNK